jgi:hypothetical protein
MVAEAGMMSPFALMKLSNGRCKTWKTGSIVAAVKRIPPIGEKRPSNVPPNSSSALLIWADGGQNLAAGSEMPITGGLFHLVGPTIAKKIAAMTVNRVLLVLIHTSVRPRAPLGRRDPGRR